MKTDIVLNPIPFHNAIIFSSRIILYTIVTIAFTKVTIKRNTLQPLQRLDYTDVLRQRYQYFCSFANAILHLMHTNE